MKYISKMFLSFILFFSLIACSTDKNEIEREGDVYSFSLYSQYNITNEKHIIEFYDKDNELLSKQKIDTHADTTSTYFDSINQKIYRYGRGGIFSIDINNKRYNVLTKQDTGDIQLFNDELYYYANHGFKENGYDAKICKLSNNQCLDFDMSIYQFAVTEDYYYMIMCDYEYNNFHFNIFSLQGELQSSRIIDSTVFKLISINDGVILIEDHLSTIYPQEKVIEHRFLNNESSMDYIYNLFYDASSNTIIAYSSPIDATTYVTNIKVGYLETDYIKWENIFENLDLVHFTYGLMNQGFGINSNREVYHFDFNNKTYEKKKAKNKDRFTLAEYIELE